MGCAECRVVHGVGPWDHEGQPLSAHSLPQVHRSSQVYVNGPDGYPVWLPQHHQVLTKPEDSFGFDSTVLPSLRLPSSYKTSLPTVGDVVSLVGEIWSFRTGAGGEGLFRRGGGGAGSHREPPPPPQTAYHF